MAFIQKKEELSKLVSILLQEKVIGLDTEFIRETSFYPQLALIQIATDKDVWLLDPLAFSRDEIVPFLDILENPKIIKIMHAAFSDQECFYSSYKTIANPTFDTAIAGALLGYGENIGLAKLMEDVLNIRLIKGRSRVKWLTRPLPAELIEYAEDDVRYLVKLYLFLEDLLKKKGRYDWVMKKSQSEVSLFNNTEKGIVDKMCKNARLDVPSRNVLAELILWREKRAKDLNIPRNWVVDNDTIISLARSKPKRIDELKSFRGLKLKEIERNGELLLRLIEESRSKNVHFDSYDNDRGKIVVDPVSVQFFNAYLNFLAKQYQIASHFLINAENTVKLSSLEPSESHKIKDILGEDAFELVGKELINLIEGKTTVTYQDKKWIVTHKESD